MRQSRTDRDVFKTLRLLETNVIQREPTPVNDAVAFVKQQVMKTEIKCPMCSRVHSGEWPHGYTAIYCECGHEITVFRDKVKDVASEEQVIKRNNRVESKRNQDLQVHIAAHWNVEDQRYRDFISWIEHRKEIALHLITIGEPANDELIQCNVKIRELLGL